MGSYEPTLNMKAILVLLLVTCLLVEAGRPRKNNNKKQKSKSDSEKGRRVPRHGDKGERVWHIAASEEECGDASATLYQSHDKPYDLCSEVNTTINVCTTRDTEMVPAPAVDVAEEVDESENEIEARHDMDAVYQPKEGAEWDFKTGTCVFRLAWNMKRERKITIMNTQGRKRTRRTKRLTRPKRRG